MRNIQVKCDKCAHSFLIAIAVKAEDMAEKKCDNCKEGNYQFSEVEVNRELESKILKCLNSYEELNAIESVQLCKFLIENIIEPEIKKAEQRGRKEAVKEIYEAGKNYGDYWDVFKQMCLLEKKCKEIINQNTTVQETKEE